MNWLLARHLMAVTVAGRSGKTWMGGWVGGRMNGWMDG